MTWMHPQAAILISRQRQADLVREAKHDRLARAAARRSGRTPAPTGGAAGMERSGGTVQPAAGAAAGRGVSTIDVLVIGAGQAGLAAGYWLRRTGLRFLLVDRASRLGESWRQRWDSLTLFTPAAYSALPEVPLAGHPAHYPTKDEVADYLEAYADRFRLPIHLGEAVSKLERDEGGFVATLDSGHLIRSPTVIVATGPFQVPAVPRLADTVGRRVIQLTPKSYRRPSMVPPGTVLIVGDGASGRQIALDLAATHRVVLATGRPRHLVPDRIFGRSIFWWLTRLGVSSASRDGFVGRLLRARDPFPGKHLALRQLRSKGVVTRPRLKAIEDDVALFGDGSQETITAVVWATGYRDDTGWLRVPGALVADGVILERGGLSDVGGLFYVGRSWQRTRGSALLHGVGADARVIVECAVQSVERQRTPPAEGKQSCTVRDGMTGRVVFGSDARRAPWRTGSRTLRQVTE